jgi:protoporphyrinogen oxidase
VLCADDNLLVLDMLAKTLESAGHHVEVVTDGRAAVSRLMEDPDYFQVIVTDTRMPKLDGFGYIAPQNTCRDVLGVQWCSSIFPDRAPAGMVLWRALCGGWNRAEVAGWPDDRLIDAVRGELQRALGIAAPPAFVHIARWPAAIVMLVHVHI